MSFLTQFFDKYQKKQLFVSLLTNRDLFVIIKTVMRSQQNNKKAIDFFDLYNQLFTVFYKEHTIMTELLLPGELQLVGTYSTPNPAHRHKSWELLIVESGIVLNYINGKPYKVSAGDVFLLGPAHLHAIEVLSPQHLHRDLYFNTPDIERALEMFPDNLKKDILSGKQLFSLQLDINELTSLKKNISDLELIGALPTNCTQKIDLKSISLSILQYVFGIYSLNLYSKQKTYPEWFYSILINLHSPSVFTQRINSIIKTTNYSHSQIGNYFKKYIGITLIEYIKNLRLNYAAKLLKTTSHSTLFICENCGYDAYSHFERIFKKKFGCSPSKYRKHYLSNQQGF